MSRFQAQADAVLSEELEDLRLRLGLRGNQKADLLRELTALAAWVVRQAAEGRVIVARGDDAVHELAHPAIDRVRRMREVAVASPDRLELSDDEARRLADILDRRFEPSPALIQSLRNINDPARRAPELTWTDSPA